MNTHRIDQLSRLAARPAGRRSFVVALALAFAISRLPARADAVETEGSRCRGKRCTADSQCGKGLDCAADGRCAYAKRNCGKQKDRCCASGECCGDYYCVHGNCRRR